MTLLDKIYSEEDSKALPVANENNWCKKGFHILYDYFPDFNEWIDGADGFYIREQNGIDNLSNPSKAFFASDQEAYHQAFKIYQSRNLVNTLSKERFYELFNSYEWYEINLARFEQLLALLEKRKIVPFIGAGVSAASGYPTWKHHLIQQAKVAGLAMNQVNELLNQGKYESVIEEIEGKGRRDVFIQEIKDVFNKLREPSETILRITELFTDIIITTNYERLIEYAYEKIGEKDIQVLDTSNMLEKRDINKTTILKIHGDINIPSKCIISKEQYQRAYGTIGLDLSKPIPKTLSQYYCSNSLLFIGSSLNRDRTMEVFGEAKNKINEVNRPQHFSFEAIPETELELTDRNAYLLNYGITPIWFPKGSYDYIEQILRLARNEMRYRGHIPIIKKQIKKPVQVFPEKIETSGIKRALNFISKLLGSL